MRFISVLCHDGLYRIFDTERSNPFDNTVSHLDYTDPITEKGVPMTFGDFESAKIVADEMNKRVSTLDTLPEWLNNVRLEPVNV